GPPFLAIVAPDPALAACTVVGGVTTCDTAAPNPWTTRVGGGSTVAGDDQTVNVLTDRKSTRLNSSHRTISYAVFCLKKKRIDRGKSAIYVNTSVNTDLLRKNAGS